MSQRDNRGNEEMAAPEMVGDVLTDEQWDQLAKLGTLPARARADIEIQVLLAKEFYEAERPAAQQRRRKIIREAADLAAKLKHLAVQFRESNVVWLDTEEEDERALLDQLEKFERKMRSRIMNFKTGPVTDGVHFVVQGLNSILIEHANRALNLSTNNTPDGFDAQKFTEKFFEFSGYPRAGTGLRSRTRSAIKEMVDVMGSWKAELRPGVSSRKGHSSSKRRIGWMFEA